MITQDQHDRLMAIMGELTSLHHELRDLFEVEETLDSDSLDVKHVKRVMRMCARMSEEIYCFCRTEMMPETEGADQL